jgi:hypothetical protein
MEIPGRRTIMRSISATHNLKSITGCILFFITCDIFLPLPAQVYKWVDENGKTHYSDKPDDEKSKLVPNKQKTGSSGRPWCPYTKAGKAIKNDAGRTPGVETTQSGTGKNKAARKKQLFQGKQNTSLNQKLRAICMKILMTRTSLLF